MKHLSALDEYYLGINQEDPIPFHVVSTPMGPRLATTLYGKTKWLFVPELISFNGNTPKALIFPYPNSNKWSIEVSFWDCGMRVRLTTRFGNTLEKPMHSMPLLPETSEGYQFEHWFLISPENAKRIGCMMMAWVNDFSQFKINLSEVLVSSPAQVSYPLSESNPTGDDKSVIDLLSIVLGM